ncbi:MAG TPA: tetratricopeptide repeat protein [Anaerolineae bacterium]|nr:tetratricopeptide repeat protein [Anaerolineae bacterium]
MPDKRSGGADFEADELNVGGDIAGRDIDKSRHEHYYGPPSRRSELPHQPYFFGREEELARIADALDPETTGWGVLIDGPGGMGKTALAIRAGHLASDATYPTKIFLSAKARELTPEGEQSLQDFLIPNYLSLLTELAHELGEGSIERLDPSERTRAVRRVLESRQALIIIDNLETFDETERTRLFQFLKRLPRSCKAIITSRRRADVAAEIIRLDRLSRVAAHQLIAKLAERYPLLARSTEIERQRLYETAGGNPLLIEWIAGQLGRPGSQCRTVADACDYMLAGTRDSDPLEYIFGDLLNTFDEHERVVLGVLSYFTEPVKGTSIAELAKLPLLNAQTILEDLTYRALVISDIYEESYFLAPLVTTLLHRRCPEVVAQIGNYLVDHVFTLALENGYQNKERFPVLDSNWPLIAASLPLFLLGDFPRLRRLYAALKTFLDTAGRLDEWLACARRVEAWTTSVSGVRKQALNLRLEGAKHQLQENYSAAIEAYKQSIDLWLTIEPESYEVANGLSDLAGAERLSGNHMAAERDYREALRIAEKVEDREGQAIYIGNLAELMIERQQWLAAESLAKQALRLSETSGRWELIAASCEFISRSLVRQGRPTEGIEYAQRAVDIYTKLRSPYLGDAQAVLRECEE